MLCGAAGVGEELRVTSSDGTFVGRVLSRGVGEDVGDGVGDTVAEADGEAVGEAVGEAAAVMWLTWLPAPQAVTRSMSVALARALMWPA